MATHWMRIEPTAAFRGAVTPDVGAPARETGNQKNRPLEKAWRHCCRGVEAIGAAIFNRQFCAQVSNDPAEDPDLNPLDAPDGAFLSDIMVPFEAIMSARSGHGRLAMSQVEAVLDHLAGPACGAQTARVRVWPQFISTAREGNSVPEDDTSSEDKTIHEKKTSRPVSMSWWLSTPIQIHLHQQTEGTRSNNKNQTDIGNIWTALDKPPGCIGQLAMPSAAEAQRAKGPATAAPD
jgi:hypothetical protein